VSVFSDVSLLVCSVLVCSFLSQFIGSLMGGPMHHGPVNIQLYVFHKLQYHNCCQICDCIEWTRNFHPTATSSYCKPIWVFLSDFKNNGTTEISKFFCIRWAIENKFLELKMFGVWQYPIGVPLYVGVAYPQKAHLRPLC